MDGVKYKGRLLTELSKEELIELVIEVEKKYLAVVEQINGDKERVDL